MKQQFQQQNRNAQKRRRRQQRNQIDSTLAESDDAVDVMDGAAAGGAMARAVLTIKQQLMVLRSFRQFIHRESITDGMELVEDMSPLVKSSFEFETQRCDVMTDADKPDILL